MVELNSVTTYKLLLSAWCFFFVAYVLQLLMLICDPKNEDQLRAEEKKKLLERRM